MLRQQGFIDDLKSILKDIQNTEILDPIALSHHPSKEPNRNPLMVL